MQEHGAQDSNHEAGNGVDVVSKEGTGSATRHDLGTSSEKIQAEKEPVEKEKDSTKTDEDHSPFLSGVDTASLSDVAPCGFLLDSLGGFFVTLLHLDGVVGDTFFFSFRLGTLESYKARTRMSETVKQSCP